MFYTPLYICDETYNHDSCYDLVDQYPEVPHVSGIVLDHH